MLPVLCLLCAIVQVAAASLNEPPVVSSPSKTAPALPADSTIPAPQPRQRVLPALAANALVFSTHHSGAIFDFRENAAVVHAMTDELVMRATQRSTVLAAWQSLVKPTDRVGVKISTKGGSHFSTHPAVLQAVVDGLVAAGVPREHIVIWDGVQSPRDLDPKATFTAAVLGKLIWGDLQFRDRHEDVSSLSHLSRVLTSGLTKIINLPVLSSSEGIGVAGAVYNLTVPNIDNWRRLTVQPNSGDPGIAELYADPNIAPKVVLTIMDGLTAQYAAGPAFQPNYAFAHNTLYASRDAVALDTIALERINEWRQMAKLPPVTEQAAYLQTAGELGLGVADRARIQLLASP